MLELIGVSGKAGSGKDYVTREFLGQQGFAPWSLAWHFKIWSVGRGLASYEEVFRTKPPRVRTLLQQTGTEEGRQVYGENIWCDTAQAWIRLLHEEWGQERIAIPDVRFPNEVELVHRMGGKVIRLLAPQRVAASPLTEIQRQHSSETSLDTYDKFDLILQNDPGDHRGLEVLEDAFAEWGWAWWETVA